MDYKDIEGNPCSLRNLIHTDPEWAATRIERMNKEIESLRQECKDWAEEHNRIVLMLEQDRDEWKRRANAVWHHRRSLDTLFKRHPEAAEWFEDKDDEH